MAAEIKRKLGPLTEAEHEALKMARRNNLKADIKDSSATLNRCIQDFIDLCKEKDPKDFTAEDVQLIINRIPGETVLSETNELEALDEVDKITYKELLKHRQQIKEGLEHILKDINSGDIWCFAEDNPFIHSLGCQKDLIRVTEGTLVKSVDEKFSAEPLLPDSPLRKIIEDHNAEIIKHTTKIAREAYTKMQELEGLFANPENINASDLEKIIREFPARSRLGRIEEELKLWKLAIPPNVINMLKMVFYIPFFIKTCILESIKKESPGNYRGKMRQAS